MAEGGGEPRPSLLVRLWNAVSNPRKHPAENGRSRTRKMPKCRATILGGGELLEIQLVTGCRSWMVPLSTPAELAISASRDLPFSRSRLLENLSKTRFALVHCGYFVALMRLKQGGDLPGSGAGTLARPNTGNRCTEVGGAIGFGQDMSGREGRPESSARTRVR